MRLLATVFVGVGISAAIAVSSFAAPSSRSPVFIGATGTISHLDLSLITVDRTTCTIDTKAAAVAGEFAVGENVSINCLGGALRSMKLAPITSGPAHTVPFLRSSIAISKPSGPTTKASISWSGGTITLGGPATSTSGPVSVSASGPIVSLDATQITVGNGMCYFYGSNLSPSQQALAQSPSSLYSYLTRANVQVGDTASLSCTYNDTSSSGHLRVG